MHLPNRYICGGKTPEIYTTDISIDHNTSLYRDGTSYLIMQDRFYFSESDFQPEPAYGFYWYLEEYAQNK